MVMIEMSGQERKIEAFIEMIRPFGIVELVRTGRIAMVRGEAASRESPTADVAKPQAAFRHFSLTTNH